MRVILFFFILIQLSAYAHECSETAWDPKLQSLGTGVSWQGVTIIASECGRFSSLSFRNIGDQKLRLFEIRVQFNEWPHEIHHMSQMPLFPCDIVTIGVPPSAYTCRLEIYTDRETEIEVRGLRENEATSELKNSYSEIQ